MPDHEFTPLADQQSSVRLVLPTIRAPARRAAATTAASLTAGLHQQSPRLRRDDQMGTAFSVQALALIAASRHQDERAAVLLGAA